MARLETWYKQDLKKPLIVHKHADVFNQDSQGNLIGVEIYTDGEPVTLTGSISGYCLLADGSTVPAVGASRTGNKASVLIPQTAYSVPGPITVTIKNVDGNDITTLCAVVGLVRQSVSGNMVNPGSVVTDWSDSINAQLQAVQTAADNVGAIVAAPFAENTVYVVGNYVTNNGNLYRITGDHAAGVTWANTSKTQVTVGAELNDLNRAIPAFYIPGELEVRNGAISLTSGLWGFNSNNRAILKDYTGVIKGVCSVAINAGYQALIFAYELDGTFVGRWTTDNRFQISTGSALFVTGFDFRAFPNYKFNLMIKKDDGADFTPSDYGKLSVNYYTDKSLTIENAPADSNAVGDAIAAEHIYTETEIAKITNRINGHTYTEGLAAYNWVIGSIRPASGEPYNADTRIRSDFIPCGKGAYLFLADGGKDVAIYTYDKNKTWIEYAEGASWETNHTVPTDGYIRILLKKTGGAVIDESEIEEIANRLTFVYEIPEWVISSGKISEIVDTAIAEAQSTEKLNAYKSEFIQLSEFNSYGAPTKRCYTLAVITDTHGGTLSWADMVAMVNANTRTIDASCFLGDLVQEPTDVPSFYNPSEIQKPFAFCIGNHDIGGGVGTPGISPATAFTRYIVPMVAAGHITTDKNYYYFDNATYKIRTIVLFEYEAGQDTDSCLAYYYRRYISSAQLQWFADTLYDTPNDYSVLVLTHQQIWKNPTEIDHLFTKKPYYGTISSGAGIGNNMSGNAIGDIVDAFKHSKIINQTYTNNDYTTTGLPDSTVSKDFTGRENGKFICFLSGHAHAPYVIRDSTYTDQLQIIVPAATVDIHQRRYDDIRPEQTQPQYYCISFDTTNKLVKLLKIGRRVTMDMRERNFGIVEYD